MSKSWPIWHPKVHALYGEELYFLGIKLRNYDSALKYFQKEFHERVSVYEVFGAIDVLIRIYANPSERDRIQNLLFTNVGEKVAEFPIDNDNIYYTWRKPVVACEEANLRQWSREEMQEASRNWNRLPREKKQELKAQNIVLGTAVDPKGKEEIRAFIVIGTDITTPERIDELVNEIQQMKFLAGRLVGLYVGGGMGFHGHILLELGVSNEDFEKIVKSIRELHGVLHLAHPTTETFVAGNITWERIDQCRFELTLDLTLALCEERYPSMRRLLLQEKLIIVQIWERWEKLTKQENKTLADSFIDARISQQVERFRPVVVSMGGLLEEDLKEFFAAKGEEVYGKDWEERAREKLKMEKKFSMWTLGQVVEALNRWTNLEPKIFPLKSLEKLQQFVKLRNAAAHRGTKPLKKGREYSTYDIEEIYSVVAPVLQLMDEVL